MEGGEVKRLSSEIEWEELSITQKRVLRYVASAPNHIEQVAGNGRAPWLSAARALVRKGLFGPVWRTGTHSATGDGVRLFLESEARLIHVGWLFDMLGLYAPKSDLVERSADILEISHNRRAPK